MEFFMKYYCKSYVFIFRLVQQVKDISNTKSALNYAAANKIQAEYDNVMALTRLQGEIATDMDRIVVLLQANQGNEVISIAEGKYYFYKPTTCEDFICIFVLYYYASSKLHITLFYCTVFLMF